MSDFDTWDDYTPILTEEFDPKIEKYKNPNILLIDDKFIKNLIWLNDLYSEDMEEIGENLCDATYHKSRNEYGIQFYSSQSEDDMIMEKDGKFYFLSVYEIKGEYERNGILTFTGWDSNYLINIETMECEDISTR